MFSVNIFWLPQRISMGISSSLNWMLLFPRDFWLFGLSIESLNWWCKLENQMQFFWHFILHLWKRFRKYWHLIVNQMLKFWLLSWVILRFSSHFSSITNRRLTLNLSVFTCYRTACPHNRTSKVCSTLVDPSGVFSLRGASCGLPEVFPLRGPSCDLPGVFPCTCIWESLANSLLYWWVFFLLTSPILYAIGRLTHMCLMVFSCWGLTNNPSCFRWETIPDSPMDVMFVCKRDSVQGLIYWVCVSISHTEVSPLNCISTGNIWSVSGQS